MISRGSVIRLKGPRSLRVRLECVGIYGSSACEVGKIAVPFGGEIEHVPERIEGIVVAMLLAGRVTPPSRRNTLSIGRAR
jgi:hypothetical protein